MRQRMITVNCAYQKIYSNPRNVPNEHTAQAYCKITGNTLIKYTNNKKQYGKTENHLSDSRRRKTAGGI